MIGFKYPSKVVLEMGESVDLVFINGTELWHFSNLGQCCTHPVAYTCFQVAKTASLTYHCIWNVIQPIRFAVICLP